MCLEFSNDEFVKEIRYPTVFSCLFQQLVRSACSIGANVVEAKAGSTKKDWRSFYKIALKSANESKYWLCLIRDTMSVDKVAVGELLTEANEISKIIASIITNARD